jgi:hypothetical protein
VTFRLVHRHDTNPAQCPYRIVEQETGREVVGINRFPDREYVRRLAENTLRSYAMDLLHFLRWWAGIDHTDAIGEAAISASGSAGLAPIPGQPSSRPAAATINRRLGIVERALRNEFPDTVSPFAPGFQQFYWRRSPLGCGRPRPAEPAAREGTQTHRDAPCRLTKWPASGPASAARGTWPS